MVRTMKVHAPTTSFVQRDCLESRVLSHVGQVQDPGRGALADVTIHLWRHAEASDGLLDAGECSTWIREDGHEAPRFGPHDIACIVMHVFCAAVGPFEIPAGLHMAMDACAGQKSAGSPGHVSVQAYPQTMSSSSTKSDRTAGDMSSDANVIATPLSSLDEVPEGGDAVEGGAVEAEASSTRDDDLGAPRLVEASSREVSLRGIHSFFQAVKVGLYPSPGDIVEDDGSLDIDDDARDVRTLLLGESFLEDRMCRAEEITILMHDSDAGGGPPDSTHGTLLSRLRAGTACVPTNLERLMCALCCRQLGTALCISVRDEEGTLHDVCFTPDIRYAQPLLLIRHENGYNALLPPMASTSATAPGHAVDYARLCQNMSTVQHALDGTSQGPTQEALSVANRQQYEKMMGQWNNMLATQEHKARVAWKQLADMKRGTAGDVTNAAVVPPVVDTKKKPPSTDTAPTKKARHVCGVPTARTMQSAYRTTTSTVSIWSQI